MNRSIRWAVAALAFTFGLDARAADLDAGVRAFRANDVDTAIAQLAPLAALGDTDAAFYLGSIYDNERDKAHRDDVKAYELLSRSARVGNHMAEVAVLQMRVRGKVSFAFGSYALAKPQREALEPLRRAALGGKAGDLSADDLARLAVATCEDTGGGNADTSAPVDMDRHATEWLERAAAAGQPQAQFLVGMGALGRQPCFGRRPQVDIAAGQAWVRKAAAQGLPQAAVTLAYLERFNMPGLSHDLPAAIDGLRKAVARKDPQALDLLGDYTLQGVGMKADRDEALRLYRAAAELGDENAMRALAEQASLPAATPEDWKQAIAWYRRCAQAGDPQCQFMLASFYFQGGPVDKDLAQFVTWMKASSANDAGAASAQLGKYFLLFPGPDNDPKKGLDYLRTGVARGNALAMVLLGDEYMTGTHVPREPAKAWALLQLAAQRNFPDARNAQARLRVDLKPEDIERGDRIAKAWRVDDRTPGSWWWTALTSERVGEDKSDRF